MLHLALRFHFVLWDEAVYIAMGKYIYSFGHSGLWEPLRPLGLPLLFGAVWKLNMPVIGARIIEFLFASGSIIMVYLISKKLFSRDIALINAFLLMITPLFFYNSLRLLTGIPSLFLILAGTYLYLNKKYFYAGLFASLAFLFRFPHGLFLVCIILSLFIEFLFTKIDTNNLKLFIKKSTYVFLGFLPLTIIFLIFNQIAYQNLFHTFIKAAEHQGNLVHAVQGFWDNLLYYPIELYNANFLVIFAVVALFFIFKDKLKEYKKYNLIITSLIIYLIYFTFITNKQPRFSLGFIGFVFILLGYGLMESIHLLKKNKFKLVYFILIVLIAYSVSLAVKVDYHKFAYFPPDESPIVDEYYRFLDGFEGNVLTSDPVPAAYTDVLMIPYYYSVDEGLEIIRKHLAEKSAGAIVFNKGPFVCFDEQCEINKQELFNIIQENIPAFEKEYEEYKWVYYIK